MNSFLLLDTETGGLFPEASLLTAWFGIVRNNKIIDELYLKLQPNDKIYKIQTSALKINGIDLAKHDENAITYKEAKTILFNFLNKNTESERLTCLGHGVQGDVQKVTSCLISEDNWYKFIRHNPIDTITISKFFISLGLLPDSSNLASLKEFFKIESQLHDAKEDAIASWEIYKKFTSYVGKTL